MIQPLFPDDEDSAVLDAVNAQLRIQTDVYNHTPQSEIGGFTPDMLFRLKYNGWNTPESPLKFNTALPLKTLSSAPYFLSLRNLLLYVAEQGNVKATAAGNLSRKAVGEVADFFWTPEIKQDHFKYSKVLNEGDVRGLAPGRYVLETAGLLKKRKGSFYVPKTKQYLLEDKQAGPLFELLFTTHFRKLNLGYPGRYPDTFDVIQQDVDYALFTLGRVAKKWTALSGLPEKVLHPMTLGALSKAVKSNTYFKTERVLDFYLLRAFKSWGLVESKEKDGDYLEESKKIRVTGFYQKWIRFDKGC